MKLLEKNELETKLQCTQLPETINLSWNFRPIVKKPGKLFDKSLYNLPFHSTEYRKQNSLSESPLISQYVESFCLHCFCVIEQRFGKTKRKLSSFHHKDSTEREKSLSLPSRLIAHRISAVYDISPMPGCYGVEMDIILILYFILN